MKVLYSFLTFCTFAASLCMASAQEPGAVVEANDSTGTQPAVQAAQAGQSEAVMPASPADKVQVAPMPAEVQNTQAVRPRRNDQFGLFNHLGIGIDFISPDGFGIGVGACITPWLQVRAGYSIVPWQITTWPVSINGVGTAGQPIAYDVKLKNRDIHLEAGAFMMRHTGSLMFDFFPSRKSSFHLTVGMLGGSYDILTIKNTKPVDFGDVGIAFYPGGDKSATNMQRINLEGGNIQISVGRALPVRPYVGLGWGSFVPSKRVGVMFDMGVEYNGGMGLYVNAKNIHGELRRMKLDGPGLITLIEDVSEKPADASVNRAGEIYQRVSGFPVSGYLKLALVVKIF